MGITRVHMEEDAGKLVHAGGATGRIHGADYSLVDFNRGGTPLVEIVTEPDIRTPDQARSFLTQLRSLVQRLGVSDVNMEEGSLRCDANVSRPPAGRAVRHQDRAEEHELLPVPAARPGGGDRAADRLPRGAANGRSGDGPLRPGYRAGVRLRSKEEAHDYRYFPEPDLAPDRAGCGLCRACARACPSCLLPARSGWSASTGCLPRMPATLAGNKGLGDYFETLASRRPATPGYRLTGCWATCPPTSMRAGLEVSESVRGRRGLAELLGLVRDGTLSGKMAKEVFEAMATTGKDARSIVAEKGLGQISDVGELDAIVAPIIVAQTRVLPEEFRQGNQKVLGFFVGQVMKETKGQANPQLVNELLRKHFA